MSAYNHSKFWAEVCVPDRDSFDGKSHGWIQWKGTSVCIDLYCICGAHGHIDEEFFYHYKCLACGRKYAVGANVALIELNEEQAHFVESTTVGFLSDPETEK